MTQPQPPSNLEPFAQRLSLAIVAAESGETEFDGQPIDKALQKFRGQLETLLKGAGRDSLLQVTAEEQLRRINTLLMGIAA